MTLLVDTGNSRVKWGWLEGTEIEAGETFPTDAESLPGQLQARWQRLSEPRAIYLSNVAGPGWEVSFLGWIRATWNSKIYRLRAAADAYGIVNAYKQPETLGVDRWVGMIAARGLFGLPFCLIDCGTAVTVDLVDRQGMHHGGLIAPGLKRMKDSLPLKIPVVGAAEGVSRGYWGRDTTEGVETGTREMILGLIGRAVDAAQRTLGEAPVVVLTGGDAERIAALLEIPHRLAPDLVLQGLATIARQDRSAALGG